MANFNIGEVFKGTNVKKICEQFLKLSEEENSIKLLVAKTFKVFKETSKEDIFVSGLLLGKYIAINDMEINEVKEKEVEKDVIKYIG